MTWAEIYHDAVGVWLRPFRSLYAKYGHAVEDIEQEARLALVEQNAYLSKLGLESTDRVRAAAKTIALRSVKRRLLGRAKTPTPVFDTGPDGWALLFEAEAREHAAEIQLELGEAVANAPGPVKMYLSHLLAESDIRPEFHNDALHRQAANYLLDWFITRHHWRHES